MRSPLLLALAALGAAACALSAARGAAADPQHSGADAAVLQDPPFDGSLRDLYAFSPQTFSGDDASSTVREALASSFVKPLAEAAADPTGEDKAWDLWWTERAPPAAVFRGLTPSKRVNHWPGNHYLTKKATLAKLLRAMEERFPGEFGVQAETLVLPDDWERLTAALANETASQSPWFSRRAVPFSGFPAADGPDADAAGAAAPEKERPADEVEEPHWVVKTHGHRGVEVVNNGKIFPALKRDDTKFIMQRYVPAHLIDGHKYDVGFYVLVTSVEPLRAYVFDEVLLRFCPHKYPETMAGYADKDAWVIPGQGYKTADDMPTLAELRNAPPPGGFRDPLEGDPTDMDAARTGEGAGKPQEGRRLSNAEVLRDYLTMSSVSYAEDGSVVFSRAEDRIRKVLLAAAPSMAAAARQVGQSPGNFFELVRFDFLVDTNLMPRLVEVNMSPSLEVEGAGAADAELKRRLVAETLRLSGVSVYYKETAHRVIQKLHDQVVYRGSSKAHCETDVCKKCPLDGRCALCDQCVGKRDEYSVYEMLLEHHRQGDSYRLLFPTPDPVIRTAVSVPGARVLDPAARDHPGAAAAAAAADGDDASKGGEERTPELTPEQMFAEAAAQAEPTQFAYVSYLPFVPVLHRASPAKEQRDAAMRMTLQGQVVAERLFKDSLMRDRGDGAEAPGLGIDDGRRSSVLGSGAHLVDASDAPVAGRPDEAGVPGMPGDDAGTPMPGAGSPDPTDPTGVNHEPYRLDSDGKRYTQPWLGPGGLGSMLGGDPGWMPWEDPDANWPELPADDFDFGDIDTAPDMPEDFVGPDADLTGKGAGQHINLGEPVDGADSDASFMDPFDMDADLDDQDALAAWAREMQEGDGDGMPEGLTEEQMKQFLEEAAATADDADMDADSDAPWNPGMFDAGVDDTLGDGLPLDDETAKEDEAATPLGHDDGERAFGMRSELPPTNYVRSALMVAFFAAAAYAVVSFLNGRRHKEIRAGDQDEYGSGPASAASAGVRKRNFVSNV